MKKYSDLFNQYFTIINRFKKQKNAHFNKQCAEIILNHSNIPPDDLRLNIKNVNNQICKITKYSKLLHRVIDFSSVLCNFAP